MSASDYVNTYLHLWCSVKNDVGTFAVRNYLQSEHKEQAKRAQIAKGQLLSKIPQIPGYAPVKKHHEMFTVGGEVFLYTSISRVFIGKGAPNEIQDVVWLASLAGMVTMSTLPAWADANLGVDCGGFVANYWGMGRPTEIDPQPHGFSGFLPRTFWDMSPSLRRKEASQIRPDDAAVFFQDVKSDNPDIAARKGPDGKTWDRSTGSQAHHIGVVDAITPAGGNQYIIRIAESSEAKAMSGGNGVNWRYLGGESTWAPGPNGFTPPGKPVELKVAHNLVCYQAASGERVYFVGRPNGDPPYPQENQSYSATS